MRKKVLIASLITGVLILGFTAAILLNHPAFAKNQQTIAKANETRMSKYTPPKKQHSTVNVRKSRLKQMNIVSEAATVLNVLPITIIDEMKKGKTLPQIAQDKGLTEKEFTQKLADLETKIVNNAVSDGTIPKKHKDAINAGKSERLKNALKAKAVDANDHEAMDMGN